MEWAEQGGRLAPLSLPITAALREVICSPKWYSFTLYNDGPNAVYPDVNRTDNAVNLSTPVNLNNSLNADFEQPKIDRIYLACLLGQTANVRIFGTW